MDKTNIFYQTFWSFQPNQGPNYYSGTGKSDVYEDHDFELAIDIDANCGVDPISVDGSPIEIYWVPYEENIVENKITASDPARFGAFGSSVAIGDNRIVVGARNTGNQNNGSIYIYDLNGNEIVKINRPEGDTCIYFGTSVAIGDGRIVVGSFGSAYIFDLDGNQIAKITAIGGDTGTRFGRSVAVGDGRIVVGNYGDNDKGEDSGAAYIFDLDGNQIAKITASDGASGDHFGYSVAIGDNRIVANAPNHDKDDEGNEIVNVGAAYIFDLNGNEISKIVASDAAGGNFFGSSVAIGDGRIVVTNTVTISFYIFDLNGVEIAKIRPIDADDLDRYDKFGELGALAIGDGRIVVGSSGNNSIYIYDLSGNPISKIIASDPAQLSGNFGHSFGASVAIDDGIIVVGDDGYEDSTQRRDSGAAYIFDLNGNPSSIDNELFEFEIYQSNTPFSQSNPGTLIYNRSNLSINDFSKYDKKFLSDYPNKNQTIWKNDGTIRYNDYNFINLNPYVLDDGGYSSFSYNVSNGRYLRIRIFKYSPNYSFLISYPKLIDSTSDFQAPRKSQPFPVSIDLTDIDERKLDEYNYSRFVGYESRELVTDFIHDKNIFTTEIVGYKNSSNAIDSRLDKDYHYVRYEYDLSGKLINEVERFYSYNWHFRPSGGLVQSPIFTKVLNAPGLFVLFIDLYNHFYENVHALIWNMEDDIKIQGLEPYETFFDVDKLSRRGQDGDVHPHPIPEENITKVYASRGFIGYSGRGLFFLKKSNYVYVINSAQASYSYQSFFSSPPRARGNKPGIARHHLTHDGKAFSPVAHKMIDVSNVTYKNKKYQMYNSTSTNGVNMDFSSTDAPLFINTRDNVIYLTNYKSGYTEFRMESIEPGYEGQSFQALFIGIDLELNEIQTIINVENVDPQPFYTYFNPTPPQAFSIETGKYLAYAYNKSSNPGNLPELYLFDISETSLNRYPLQDLKPRPPFASEYYRGGYYQDVIVDSFDDYVLYLINSNPSSNVTSEIISDTGWSSYPDNFFRGAGTNLYPRFFGAGAPYTEMRAFRLKCGPNPSNISYVSGNIYRYTTCPEGTSIRHSNGQGAWCEWNSENVETIPGNPFSYPDSCLTHAKFIGSSSPSRFPDELISRDASQASITEDGRIYTIEGLWSPNELQMCFDDENFQDPDEFYNYFVGEDLLIAHTIYIDPDNPDFSADRYHCIDSLLGLNFNEVTLEPTEKFSNVMITIGFHNGPKDGEIAVQYTHHENLLKTYRNVVKQVNLPVKNITAKQLGSQDAGIRIRTLTGDNDRKTIAIDGKFVNNHFNGDFKYVEKGENCKTSKTLQNIKSEDLEKNKDLYYALPHIPEIVDFEITVEYEKNSSPNCVLSESFIVHQPFTGTGKEFSEFLRNYIHGDSISQIEIPKFPDEEQ